MIKSCQKILFWSLAFSGLSACNAFMMPFTQSPRVTPLNISAQYSESSIDPVIKQEELRLGQTTISDWTGPMPKCSPCALNINRHYHPDGPSTQLTLLYQDDGYSWTLFETFRGRERFSGVSVKYQQGAILVTVGQQSIVLAADESQTFLGCDYQAIWIEHKGIQRAPEPNGLSDDQSKFHIQLVRECVVAP